MSKVRRHSGSAALLLSVFAVVLSSTGLAGAARRALFPASARPRPHALLLLGANGRFPAAALPKEINAARLNGLTAHQISNNVNAARLNGLTAHQISNNVNAAQLNGVTAQQLIAGCPANTADIGSYCVAESTFLVPPADAGMNNYFYATRTCARLGGYLPSAAQLIGAADKVSLESVIGDDPNTATVDADPSDGLKDLREMTATLITTAAGSSAAGSEGVSDTATGDPRSAEPNPTPQPADPQPQTLQYVTVYDNSNMGGFAGAAPVSSPENFRCAYNKTATG